MKLSKKKMVEYTGRFDQHVGHTLEFDYGGVIGKAKLLRWNYDEWHGFRFWVDGKFQGKVFPVNIGLENIKTCECIEQKETPKPIKRTVSTLCLVCNDKWKYCECPDQMEDQEQ